MTPFPVPDGCSLPTAEQPLRVAEFDTLFATAVRRVEPVGPTHTRLRLAGAEGLEAAVRDLTARESACCSFFAFTVTPDPDGAGLVLDIAVPAVHADVLAALTERAAAALPAGR